MRIMGLDVGGRRIGVAVSGPAGLLAEPLTTLARREDDRAVERVAELARRHRVDEVVVGLPLEPSGREGPQARRVKAFVRKLATRLEIPIREVDERYTTQQARRLMIERGLSPSRDKGREDAVAAAVILQAYLDARRRRAGATGSAGPSPPASPGNG